MFRIRKCVVAALIACSSVAAFASGTEQEQAACRPDVQKYCRAASEAPESVAGTREQVVLLCLKENRQKLTQACLKVLEDHGQ